MNIIFTRTGKSGVVPTVILLLFSILLTAQKPADLIIHNAKIYTVNQNFDTAEAMAVSKGKIVAVGSGSEILKFYSSKNIQNLQGKAVFPGFIDAHCHFSGYATDKWKCELWGTKSWEEILQRMTDYAKNAPMEWLYGRSWDQNNWAVKEFPDKAELDQLFPNRPVYLKRVDGHAAIANQKALDIAGITAKTKVKGGEIEKVNGKLTGILIDNAMLLVEKHIPEISDELAIRYFGELQTECFSYGLTSLHDCGISAKTFGLLEKAQEQEILKMKIFALLEDNKATYDTWIGKGRFTKGNITFGGYKVYSDGALGSRGACLLHDYSDKKDWKGFLLSDKKHFKNLADKLANSNLQMCTHAIGDSANRTILQIYGDVLAGKNDRRWRIEHAQIVDKSDLGLFAKYSVIPSVQPTHATSDMYWAESRIGKERLTHSYAYQDLLQQNGWLPLGTDFPVEEINPIKTFYAAVARKDAKNFPANGFQKENALTREQALRGMTIWAAKAAFQEKELGSLEVGKSADFVVLTYDIIEVPEDRILQTWVLETYSNGIRVYDGEKWRQALSGWTEYGNSNP
ncbi:amidohydrolase family protein [Chryseobacterium sp. cx-311]|uniref:amidohydrolase n=1 Tax=Marnyiella aurantia TaxID=2758037 RepID=UPI001AE69D50|nr:amidohydrolase [Marnyiella aurantia]MBP0612407.1 amidohydrolase family protein [Marnyiella aurantia]